MGKKVRIDEREAHRLDGLLKNKIVVTKKGHEGSVTKVTRGGIQVHRPKSKTMRPYPIYDSFISGELRFKDEVCQNEMLDSLYEAAESAGIAPPARIATQTEPHVSQIDVPNNIRIVCFFKNVEERSYLDHMKGVGIEGFDESLEAGVRQSPFVTLRETEYHLGCSLKLLLSSPEELMERILRESSASTAWRWTESMNARSDDGLPLRSV